MTKRIRVNGVLYEAVDSLHENDHPEYDDDWNVIRKLSHSKLRWRVPSERDISRMHFGTNMGLDLPDGSDPRYYQARAYQGSTVFVLLQGDRNDRGGCEVVLGDSKFDVTMKKYFRSLKEGIRFFEKVGVLIREMVKNEPYIRSDDAVAMISIMLGMGDPKIGTQPSDKLYDIYADYL